MSFIRGRIQSHLTGDAAKETKPAVECTDCNKAVAGVGLEKEEKNSQTSEQKTVAMVGPLGVAFTEALNKKYAKNKAGDQFTIGAESMSNQIVQLRDSVNKHQTQAQVTGAIARSSVGMSQTNDTIETSVNPKKIINQIADNPELVDFVFVQTIDPIKNGSSTKQTTEYSLMIPEIDADPENVAIESFTIIVNYHKK